MNNCNCNSNKIQPASITPLPALGSVASPYFVQVNISQRLCFSTCVEQTPVFAPIFSLKKVEQVGIGQYMATIHVEGVISYAAYKAGCNCAKTQPLSQDFTLPMVFPSSTVTITQGAAVNSMSASGCQQYSRAFVSETPLTITVAAA